MQNHFDLFHLPQQFVIDASALEQAYRRVQSQVHPDKFAAGSDTEKRVAMQWATRANEAYQTLKNPLKRASYLCELHGVDLGTESNTAMPRQFLMQQMEWRETLDEVRAGKDIDALEVLDRELREAHKAQIAEVGAKLDAADYEGAAQAIRQLMFLDKFGAEISQLFELLEH
ncbi:MAG TPA: Fe-S protein assembly co-chaperone HscB [Burkholderiaceae bacterium]